MTFIRLFLLALGILFSNHLHADFERRMDSIKREIDTTTTMYYKGLNYNRLACDYVKIDTDSVFYFATKAADVARAIEDSMMLSIANVYKGIAAYYFSDFEASLAYYKKAVDFYRSINDQERLAQTLTNKGLLYIDLQQIEKAREILEECLYLQEEVEDEMSMISVLINLSIVHEDDPEVELDYLYQALKKAQKLEIPDAISHVSINIISVFVEVGEVDSSLVYLAIAQENQNNLLDTIRVYYSLGSIKKLKGDFDEAISAYEEGLRLAYKMKHTHLIGRAFQGLAQVYKAKGDYEQALQYATQSFTLKEEIFSKERLQKLANMEKKYQFQLIQAAIKEEGLAQDLKFEKSQLQTDLAKRIIIALMVFMVAFSYYTYAKKKSEEHRQAELKLTNEKILLQKQKLEESKRKLETLNAYKSNLFLALSKVLFQPMGRLKESVFAMTQLQKKPETEEIAKTVSSLSSQVIQVAVFLESLLEWSKVQMTKGEEEEQEATVFLPEAVLMELTNRMAKLSKMKQLSFDFNLPHFETLKCKFPEFKALFINLLGASIHFSDRNGLIMVKGDKDAAHYRFQIYFQTKFLTPKQYVAIHEPTLDLNAETSEKEGVASGFFITKEMTRMIDATWKIAFPEENTCSFSVTIPLS